MNKLILAVTALAVLVAACGGNVVVDTPGSGGTATTTSTSTVLTASSTGSAVCFGAPPMGSLTLCGGSSGASGCAFSYCTQGSQDTYEANCTSTTCQCLHNSALLCTCALTSAGDICSGTPDCCFAAP